MQLNGYAGPHCIYGRQLDGQEQIKDNGPGTEDHQAEGPKNLAMGTTWQTMTSP